MNILKRICSNKISIVGVYFVEENEHVFLIEIEHNPKFALDMDSITQSEDNQPKDSWQVPYEERFLTDDGKILSRERTNRIVFYFHYLNFKKPLITSLGSVSLPKPSKLPSRLESLIQYEPVD